MSTIQIAEGMICRQENEIDIYTLHVVGSAQLDAWVDYLLTRLECHPIENPYQAVYDFSLVSVLHLNTFKYTDIGSLGLTLPGNEAVRKVLARRPGLTPQLAIVTSRNLSAYYAKWKPAYIAHKRKYFFDLSAAIQWLQSLTV